MDDFQETRGGGDQFDLPPARYDPRVDPPPVGPEPELKAALAAWCYDCGRMLFASPAPACEYLDHTPDPADLPDICPACFAPREILGPPGSAVKPHEPRDSGG